MMNPTCYTQDEIFNGFQYDFAEGTTLRYHLNDQSLAFMMEWFRYFSGLVNPEFMEYPDETWAGERYDNSMVPKFNVEEYPFAKNDDAKLAYRKYLRGVLKAKVDLAVALIDYRRGGRTNERALLQACNEHHLKIRLLNQNFMMPAF